MEDAQSRASRYRNAYMLGRHRDVLNLSALSPADYKSACRELDLAPEDIAFDCLPRVPEVEGYTLVSGVALVITPPSPEALLVPWKQHRKGRITVAYGPSALLLHRAYKPTSGRVVIVGPLSKSGRFSYVDLAPDPEEWSPALLRAFFEDAESVLIEQRHQHVHDALFRTSIPNNGVRILAPWQSTAKWVWTARALAPSARIQLRSWGGGREVREFLP